MKSSFSAAGCEEVYKLLHYSLLHKCAVYTFSLHSIHSRGVGHMEKEPESKTPPWEECSTYHARWVNCSETFLPQSTLTVKL